MSGYSRAALRRKGIKRAQARKAAELAVAGRKRRPVFDGQRRKVRVCRQSSERLPFADQLAEDFKMPLARRKNNDRWPVEP